MTGVPLPRPPEWMNEALCAEVGGDGWFPEPSQPAGAAKKTCGRCPVRLDCLGWALDNNERWGVWGGYSEIERRRMRRKMPKKPGGWKWSDASTKDKVRQLTAMGWSAAAIGVELGITSRTVQRIRAEWRAKSAA